MDMKDLHNILFLRHFKTEFNYSGIITGNIDVSVSEIPDIVLGLEYLTNDINIFTSPARRCIETLNFCSEMVRYSFSNIKIVNELTERNFGYWQGKSKKEIIFNFPYYFDNYKFNYLKTPPCGESFEEINKRIDKVLEEIAIIDNNHRILICSHNHIMKLLVCRIYDIDIMDSFEFINGKIYNYEDIISSVSKSSG